MTTTLFSATLEAARLLNAGMQGVSTGGSATTLIDTVALQQADDFWGGGTHGATGTFWNLDAGEYSRVTDFVNSTNTATVPDITTALSGGENYYIATPRYDLYMIINAVNTVMQQATFTKEDTSLTTSGGLREYNTPAGVCAIKQVWVQADTTTSNNQWRRMRNWYVTSTGPAAQDVLVFRDPPPDGMTIKLVHEEEPTEVVAATDIIASRFPLRWVAAATARQLLRMRAMNLHDVDKGLNNQLNLLTEIMQQHAPPARARKLPSILTTS